MDNEMLFFFCFFVYFLLFHGQNVKNEAFCVKWGPNEVHFSNLVLMRTKSSIEDLFATTVECASLDSNQFSFHWTHTSATLITRDHFYSINANKDHKTIYLAIPSKLTKRTVVQRIPIFNISMSSKLLGCCFHVSNLTFLGRVLSNI